MRHLSIFHRAFERRLRFGGPSAPLFALLTLLILLSGCSENSSTGATKGPGPGVPVTVSAAVEKNVPVELRAIGTVQAYSTVAVKSQVEGELIRVHFKEGQEVKKGDLLFTIDPRPFEAQIRQAEANLARDKVQAANARKDLDRYTELLKEGAATQAQYDQVRTNAEALDAALRADEAALETARLQLSYSTIESPIDGRTGSLMLHEGNLVKADADSPMVTINQLSPIYVAFSVPQQDLPEIKKEMAAGPLKVEASPPRAESPPSRGVLTFVDNSVDPATGTIQLKATFANKERALWPGQFVNVVLDLAVQPNAVVIPSQAVQSGQQGEYVFVVKADRTVESRPVELDRTMDHEAVIRKGVNPGEQVVTDGQLRLFPGAKVEIRPSTVTPGATPGTEGGA
jgi:multidrug efflux system membrane fusion protein